MLFILFSKPKFLLETFIAYSLLDDDIASRIRVVKNKYNSSEQRYLSFEGKKEITSRIPSWDIAQVLEKLAISYDKNKEKQGCYDVVIATNMIDVYKRQVYMLILLLIRDRHLIFMMMI